MEEVLRPLIEAYASADLLDFTMRLRVQTSRENDPQVSDIMTNIRVIKGVAIVRQVLPIRRIKGGKDVLQLGVKFMPDTHSLTDTLDFLGKETKKIEGVEIVMFLTVGGRDVRKDSGDPYIY